MKSKQVLKLGIGLILVVALCFVSFKSFAHKRTFQQVTKDPNVVITIDKSTSEEDFKDIKKMLHENGITATFTNIERNDLNEVTGLKIKLNDNQSEAAEGNISSNIPIAPITFGRKDGLLFITTGNKQLGAFGLFNQNNMMPFGFDQDSLIGQNLQSFGNFNFDDFFNDSNSSIFFNGKNMTMDELKDALNKQMAASGMNLNSMSFFFGNEDNTEGKHHFVDDPNVKKVIVIDGKESDFKTLKKLEETHQIKVVDMLKPETAISLYGQKAKDGAIIVTTK